MASNGDSANVVRAIQCMQRTLIALFTMTAIVGYPPHAGAGVTAPDQSMWSFDGFGTLGVTHSSEDNADFTSTLFKPNGAGHSRDWSADVDSLIAAQVSADLTPTLSAVLQVIAEQNYDNSYRPHVEWANIKYQFTSDLSIRAGRTLLPAFLLSETGKVAYSYPWVRPPSEVYRLEPLTSNNGVDVSYRLYLGELANTVQVSAGQNVAALPGSAGGGDARESCWGIAYTTESGSLTTSVTYLRTRLTLYALNSFLNVLRQFGPQGVALADRYDADDKIVDNIGVGASYDPAAWFVMSEWGYADTHSAIGKKTAWYVSGGYRWRKLTPYATYAQASADNLSDPGLNLSALPPSEAGFAGGLNGALNSILSAKPVQNTLTIGARWDFIKNADLKLQFDRTRIDAGSIGVLTNTQPGFRLGDQVNVFSAVIDFVF